MGLRGSFREEEVLRERCSSLGIFGGRGPRLARQDGRTIAARTPPETSVHSDCFTLLSQQAWLTGNAFPEISHIKGKPVRVSHINPVSGRWRLNLNSEYLTAYVIT